MALHASLQNYVERPADFRILYKAGVFQAVPIKDQKYHQIERGELVQLFRLADIYKIADQIIRCLRTDIPREIVDADISMWAEEGEGDEERSAAEKILTQRDGKERSVAILHKYLRSLPDVFGHFIHIERLYLSGNALSSLPDSISQLRNLKTLDLMKNEFKQIPPQVYSLAALEKLLLDSNEITEIPDDIKRLTNLHTLTVCANPLQDLPIVLGRLPKLAQLELGGNQFGALPQVVRDLHPHVKIEWSVFDFSLAQREFRKIQEAQKPKKEPTFEEKLKEWADEVKGRDEHARRLKAVPALCKMARERRCGEGLDRRSNTIDLHDYLLTSLPACLGNCKWIERLYLSRNYLEVLPDFIGELPNLTHLDLAITRFKTLPDNFRNLTKLKYLRLEWNALSEIPAVVWELHSLEELDMARNIITTIPPAIANLRKLKHLKIANNDITQLPEELAQIRNLESIYAPFNKLTSIPRSFGQLRACYLSVESNPLTQRAIDDFKYSGIAHFTYDKPEV